MGGAARSSAREALPEPTVTVSRTGIGSRLGKSNVTGYYSPAVKRQLKILAAQEEVTIQALLAEALNGLFAARGLPEIAEPR